MFPAELTFGVFDATVTDCPIAAPKVWIWQTQSKDSRIFSSLIDGGSILNNRNENSRYLMRSVTCGEGCVVNNMIPKSGDVIRLNQYVCKRVKDKTEIILVISNMEIIENLSHLSQNLPASAMMLYPHKTAASSIKKLRSEQQAFQSTPSAFYSGITSTPPTGSKNELYPSLDASPENHSSSMMSSLKQQQHEKAMVEGKEQNSQYAKIGHNSLDSYSRQQQEQIRATPYPPLQSRAGGGPISRRIDPQYIEIRNLNSFLGRWVTKGRFVNVREPRNYSNPRGEGKIWNLDLMDSTDESGVIKCTLFNKAIDKFLSVIKEDNIYSVSRGTLKPANRKFNSGTHQFELQLGEDAEIVWLSSDDPKIPKNRPAEIVKIADLLELPKQTCVSILGILMSVGDLAEIVTRSTGQPRVKRELCILDSSEMSVNVTLWGTKATQFNNSVPRESAILIENVRIDEFNGRRLSSVVNTSLKLSPNTPEAISLIKWFELEGRKKSSNFTSLANDGYATNSSTRQTEVILIYEALKRARKTPQRDLEDKGYWFSSKATLMNIDHERQVYWVACTKCGKKVVSRSNSAQFQEDEFSFGTMGEDTSENSTYFCASCNKEVLKPTKKYLLNVEIADSTGSLKCTCLGDKGVALMGNVDPERLVEVQNKPYDKSLYQKYEDFFLQRLRREYIFKIQARSETYRDETNIRYRIFSVESINGVVASDTNGPSSNSVESCRANIIKDANRTIDWIYTHIPRIHMIN